jgi:glyoxylase I family protein
MKIERFRHVSIIVRDLEKMIDFYKDILGFSLIRKFNIQSEDFQKGIGIADAEAQGAHLSVPDSQFEIEMFQFKKAVYFDSMLQANTQGYRHLAFIVDNLQESYNELQGKGVIFQSEPITVKDPKEVAGFQFVYFRDPEGNIIELNQLP